MPSARGAELHPALEPADRLARGQRLSRGVDQGVVRKRFVACAGGIERGANLVRAEGGTEQGAAHGVRSARRGRHGGTRLAEQAVTRQQRPRLMRPRRRPPRVESRRRQTSRPRSTLAVGHAVERHAASQTQIADAGLLA